jgi:hypothetical protein
VSAIHHFSPKYFIMTCLSSLAPGLFEDKGWLKVSQRSADMGMEANYSGGGILTISKVSNTNDRIVFSPNNSQFGHIFFGERYLLVTEFTDPVAEYQKQKTYFINTQEGRLLSKFLVFSRDEKVRNFMCASKGGNHVYHMYWMESNYKAHSIGFRRSDTGLVVCPLAGPKDDLELPAGIRIQAKFDGNKLIMFSNDLTLILPEPCPLPLGKSDVTLVQPFADAIIGRNVPEQQQTSLGHFLIKNVGGNCLQINRIENSAHFIVKNPIVTPVILDAGHLRDVYVKFDPLGHTGIYIEQLRIHFEGAVGPGSDTVIVCNAKARYPVADGVVRPRVE